MIEKMKWEGFIFVNFGCGCKAKVWGWEGKEVLPDRSGYKTWEGCEGEVVAPCKRHKDKPVLQLVDWELVIKAIKATMCVGWTYQVFSSILVEYELPHDLSFFEEEEN